ncbi:serine hydroxymethyltransferase [Vibrio sp. D431a]|uniref:serine hydroxymethyltransferase n=1 Tax=Vibrio sp. D431a TaxID=2837388 RepID=UPI0025534077|nr:serine hydroxymethyltransferase [Vibrio sp. D431a]MDK9793255.1 serine hydroxymethyltransferase [Vibrio sp. D431a]
MLEIKDQEVFDLIAKEQIRQERHIELIASENYASNAVMEAQGSCLTNKYAEGYSGKRYYGGCEHVDGIEMLAIERLKQLFGVEYANVQPHSGSQANQAVYQALLETGDTILGMDLKAGGHLTHGAKVSSSGQNYRAVSYGLTKDGDIDYEQVSVLAKEYRPKLIIAGFSAFSGLVRWDKFREIADSCGAMLMVDMAHVAGLVATGVYPSPVGVADVVTSTTHKTLGGPRGGIILTNREDISKAIDRAVFPACQGGPLMHVIAAKAVCFKEAMSEEFRLYQAEVVKNAQVIAEVFREEGLCMVGGGTSNHLILLNCKPYMTGKSFEDLLSSVGITLNKNSVPNDDESPFVTSGVRLGTPAITRRGFTESDCRELALIIAKLLKGEVSIEDASEVAERLCDKHPVYRQK